MHVRLSLMFVFVFQVAAQNCRKRKIDLISQLEEEVTRARQQKQNLMAEREELYRLRNEWTTKLQNLESAVLQGLNRNVKDQKFLNVKQFVRSVLNFSGSLRNPFIPEQTGTNANPGRNCVIKTFRNRIRNYMTEISLNHFIIISSLLPFKTEK